MSAQPTGDDEALSDDDLWVRSDLATDGTYIVTISAGPDTIITLDPDAALRYVSYAMAVVARAEYDAAIVAQLVDAGAGKEAALRTVIDLRADRPPLLNEWPLAFEPIVTARALAPQVLLHVAGETAGQLDTGALANHALDVLDVAQTAELDNGYRRFLVGVIGVDDDRARAAVATLGEHRHRR